VSGERLFAQRVEMLSRLVKQSFEQAPVHSRAFARYLLKDEAPPEDASQPPAPAYGGLPEVAALGFALAGRGAASEPPAAQRRELFEDGLNRLGGRPAIDEELQADDIAALGLAVGLKEVFGSTDADHWVCQALRRPSPASTWTLRARDVAADLLLEQGRLRVEPSSRDADSIALELCLRHAWPALFIDASAFAMEERSDLLEHLLVDPAPGRGDLDRCAVWYQALHLLLAHAVRDALPTVNHVVEFLRRTQASFARWVWESKATRAGVMPARWLIDNEPHVQAFLWSVLRPALGDDLVDEESLPSYGLKQPRVDFGILSLKLLIEVKMMRTPRDLKKVEDEVAADLASYFGNPKRFDRLVVYVYDDSDTPAPESYDQLRQALRARDDRVVEVLFVRRPSVMPERNARGGSV